MIAPTKSAQSPRNWTNEPVNTWLWALANEEFAIQVLPVREIMGIQEITIVLQTQEYVKAVLNLRGRVVPVVDLSMELCLPEREYNQRTCIIVAKIETRGHFRIHNEDTPDFSSGVATSYTLGMAKIKNKVRILLSIIIVFSASEARHFGTLIE